MTNTNPAMRALMGPEPAGRTRARAARRGASDRVVTHPTFVNFPFSTSTRQELTFDYAMRNFNDRPLPGRVPVRCRAVPPLGHRLEGPARRAQGRLRRARRGAHRHMSGKGNSRTCDGGLDSSRGGVATTAALARGSCSARAAAPSSLTGGYDELGRNG